MRDEPEKPLLRVLVARLVSETGISEAQAQELVALLGLNWASLVREARTIRQSRL